MGMAERSFRAVTFPCVRRLRAHDGQQNKSVRQRVGVANRPASISVVEGSQIDAVSARGESAHGAVGGLPDRVGI